MVCRDQVFHHGQLHDSSTDDTYPRAYVPGGVAASLQPRRFLLGNTPKVRAVSLGGWLVIEKWIKPSLFDGIPDSDLLVRITHSCAQLCFLFNLFLSFKLILWTLSLPSRILPGHGLHFEKYYFANLLIQILLSVYILECWAILLALLDLGSWALFGRKTIRFSDLLMRGIKCDCRIRMERVLHCSPHRKELLCQRKEVEERRWLSTEQLFLRGKHSRWFRVVFDQLMSPLQCNCLVV